MDKERIQNISFQLIGFAGDAFSYFFQALEKAHEGKFEEADQLIAEGDKQMNEAHRTQTDLLTAEASGEDMEFSVILVHAQDHLMTTMMYERVVKEFITLYKEREQK